MDLLNINKYLEKTNYKELLQIIDDKNIFYKFIETINTNFKEFNVLKMELITKLILNKITTFEGNVDNESFQIFYENLKNKNDLNFILLNSFIEKFDIYKEIKLNFLSLNFQLIKIFKDQFTDLNIYHGKNIINKEDINNIKNIIDDQVIIYYNAFFEVNYNKYFFKRIIDAKLPVTQEINTIEMIDRLRKLFKLFTIKMLETLKVEIITIQQFWDKPYLDRVNYYRQFHIKTNSLFKLYFKFYNQLNDLFYEISNITHIDPLNYVDIINDSTSSFALSEDDLEIDMNNFEDSYHFKENVVKLTNDLESIDYDNFSKSDNYADTPIQQIDDVTNINDKNHNDDKIQDDKIEDEDDDNSINDIFIKN